MDVEVRRPRARHEGFERGRGPGSVAAPASAAGRKRPQEDDSRRHARLDVAARREF